MQKSSNAVDHTTIWKLSLSTRKPAKCSTPKVNTACGCALRVAYHVKVVSDQAVVALHCPYSTRPCGCTQVTLCISCSQTRMNSLRCRGLCGARAPIL